MLTGKPGRAWVGAWMVHGSVHGMVVGVVWELSDQGFSQDNTREKSKTNRCSSMKVSEITKTSKDLSQ